MSELLDTFQKILLVAITSLDAPLPVEIQSDLNSIAKMMQDSPHQKELSDSLRHIVKKYDLLQRCYNMADKAYVTYSQSNPQLLVTLPPIDQQSDEDPYEPCEGQNKCLVVEDLIEILSDSDSVSAASRKRDSRLESLSKQSSLPKSLWSYM